MQSQVRVMFNNCCLSFSVPYEKDFIYAITQKKIAVVVALYLARLRDYHVTLLFHFT